MRQRSPAVSTPFCPTLNRGACAVEPLVGPKCREATEEQILPVRTRLPHEAFFSQFRSTNQKPRGTGQTGSAHSQTLRVVRLCPRFPGFTFASAVEHPAPGRRSRALAVGLHMVTGRKEPGCASTLGEEPGSPV